MDGIKALIDRKPWGVLSTTTLKWIAVATMLIDHIGAILVWSYYLNNGYPHDAYVAYLWLRRIGRIAFPIFCFVLVEGFVHTHSRPKYALRLFLFALVSEIPYDIALHDGLVYTPGAEATLTWQIDYTQDPNIMFTLLLAFLALWLVDFLTKLVCDLVKKIAKKDELPRAGYYVVNTVLAVAVMLPTAYLATELDLSYHAYGIFLIAGMYIGRNCPLVMFVLGVLATIWYNGAIQMYAIVGLTILLFYSGKKGRGMKYFFYVFYPAHLLILGLIDVFAF